MLVQSRAVFLERVDTEIARLVQRFEHNLRTLVRCNTAGTKADLGLHGERK